MTKNNLNHLAIIMDGNARWAKVNGKPKSAGHKAGAENVKNILPQALKLGIKHLTLYTFSSENWKRPIKEISTLFSLLNQYITDETELLSKHQVRFQVIGNISKLPATLIKKINKLTDKTKNNSNMTLTLAFSYGAREEIAEACQKALDSGIKQISEESFKQFLYDPEMPDVDIFVRTSGIHRISNFLLWQISYAEIFFSDKLWPDFNEDDLISIVNDYKKIKRNFGARNDDD